MVLTDKEIKQVLKEHREHCMKIMAECQNDAIAAGGGADVTLALFQKRALQPFTFLSSALDQKIENAIRGKDEESKKLEDEKHKADASPLLDKETGELIKDV